MKKIEEYFNYTQPDIDVPEWFNPTAKTKADSLPQTPMMSLLSSVIGPEEYEKEMGRQAARKKSWDQFEKEELQRSGSKPIGLTTGTPAEYAPRESVPAPVWQAPLDQKPEPTYGSSMVVGREMPITQPAGYAPMQAAPVPAWQAPPTTDQVPAAQVMQLSDNKGHAVEPFNPAFVNITAPQVDTRSGTYPQEIPANVLRDTAGAPVLSGTGNPFTLPNQTAGNVASGGKGGSGPNGGK
tara:strand:- start:33 stop:749 length:717 start_codon:yes stop_codon:yes gene_type:complete